MTSPRKIEFSNELVEFQLLATQRAVLDAVDEFWKSKIAPSCRDIAAYTNISVGVVNDWLHLLAKHGYLALVTYRGKLTIWPRELYLR